MRNINPIKIMRCACTEYRCWITDSRMILLSVLFVFNNLLAVAPLRSRAAQMQADISLLEPFIAIGSSGIILLILPILFMVLFSDFPRSDGNTRLYLLRIGRVNWALGQMLTLLWLVLSYLFVIAVASILPILSVSQWKLDWSSVVTDYALLFPEQARGYDLLPENLYYQFENTATAALCTYSLLALYLLLIGLILLWASLQHMRKIGLFITALLLAGGSALCSIRSPLMWLFPMAHSIPWVHYTKYLRKPEMPIGVSYLLFAIADLLLMIAAVRAAKKHEFR